MMMKDVAKRARQGNWWQRHARTAFTERLALKATALALAVVLWVSVSVREPAEEIVSVRFMPTLAEGITLRQQPTQIRALVRGSGRDILKLYSTPPAVRLSIGGEAGDSIPVTLQPGDVDLPPGVTAAVLDVQPRHFTLTLARARNGGTGAWARPSTPVETPPASP